jgi:nucleoside-diphosphate-sugar epimerase
MNCVIVGAGGFIGRHLGRRLAEQGQQVLGFDVAEAGEAPPEPFDIHRVGASELDLPPGTDAVFYLAQAPRLRDFPRGADDLFAVNVTGAVRVAAAAANAGTALFCYASSGSVYRPSFAPMSEEHPVRRDEPYALSKVVAEEALALLPGPMQVVCVRPFFVFGPGQEGRLVPDIVNRVLRGRPVALEPRPGADDADGLRVSLTPVGDAVWCLERLAELAVAGAGLPSALNIAGPQALSIRALAEMVARVAGAEPSFEFSPRTRQADYVADIGRLRALLAPSFAPLEPALAAVVTPLITAST